MSTPLLLHICCAPCGGACVERLLAGGREVRLYYSNSNLVDSVEFELRLRSVERLAEHFNVELEVDPYAPALWLQAVRGLEREPEHGARCGVCFAFSLGRTARRAAELGWHFATTLTISPCKSSEVIFASGRKFAGFEEIDFRRGDAYKRSCEIARELGFYRQNFCGCPFSVRPGWPQGRRLQ